MPGLEPPLDLNSIDALLEELSEERFVTALGRTPSADQANRLSQALGCDDNLVIERFTAGNPEDGSNLFFVLMYQNLLLAKRVAALEARINE